MSLGFLRGLGRGGLEKKSISVTALHSRQGPKGNWAPVLSQHHLTIPHVGTVATKGTPAFPPLHHPLKWNPGIPVLSKPTPTQATQGLQPLPSNTIPSPVVASDLRDHSLPSSPSSTPTSTKGPQRTLFGPWVMGRNGLCGVTGNLRGTWGPGERANNAKAAVRNSLLFLSFQGQGVGE